MGLSRSASILDIGCGNGNLIASLAEVGFRNVLGADPFIAQDIVHSNGARVLKREANEVEGQFDVVMMHHSLEHIWDQHGTVAEVARLVKSGGRCMIRIPTIDCWAWEEYGRDWIGLDPPRGLARRGLNRHKVRIGGRLVEITNAYVAVIAAHQHERVAGLDRRVAELVARPAAQH